MDLGIAGKKALVMSSSRGLGAGIAEALAAEGVDVLLTGRGEDRLKAQVEAINARGAGKADYVVSDLADAGCAATLAEAVKAKLGAADILIANTGGPPPGKMVDTDITAIPVQFERMVTRVTEVASALLPHMREQKWGRIVVVGSSGVIQPIPTLGLSNLIRSSLVGWSKSMSNDLAAEGITVNMLLPGRIHTDRVDELDGNAAEKQGKTLDEVRIASRAGIPAGRYGTVEEFAAVATFLCSAQASYVTGSLVRCDGGSIKSV